MKGKEIYFLKFLLFVIFLIWLQYTSFHFFKENQTKIYFSENNILKTKAIFNERTTFARILTNRKPILNKRQEITMKDLLLFGKNNTFSNDIPMIIHYNYKDNLLPSQYIPLVEKCIEINPKVKFVFWNDSTAHDLIKYYFPNNLNIYQSYLAQNADILKRSDVMRYFVLYLFGGIYMDLDTRCQRSMEEAMKRDSCTLSREVEVQSRILWNIKYLAMNSFMACIPNHEFFKFVINNLRKNENTGILWNTGPMFMTALFEKYNSSLNITDLKSKQKFVNVSSSDTFSPHTENYLESLCINPSGEWKIKGCKDLPAYRKVEKELISKAVVVHIFYHLGYANNKNLIKSLVDINKVRALFAII